MPRAATANRDGATLTLSTTPVSFWVAEILGRDPWVLNADHVRRWVTSHRFFLDRISEDTKFEKRWPKKKRLQMNEYREKRCRKQNDRLKSFIQESCALLANYASRNHISVVEYNDDVRDYLPSFPWFQLRERLLVKLDELGITLAVTGTADDAGDDTGITSASGEVVDETPGSAR